MVRKKTKIFGSIFHASNWRMRKFWVLVFHFLLSLKSSSEEQSLQQVFLWYSFRVRVTLFSESFWRIPFDTPSSALLSVTCQEKLCLPTKAGPWVSTQEDDSRQLLSRQANCLLCRSLSVTPTRKDWSGNNLHLAWADYRSHISGGFQ